MLHFLFPDAHVTGGKQSAAFQQAKEAISDAQSMRLAGSGMLGLYAQYVTFILDHPDGVEKFLGHPPNVAGAAERRALATLPMRTVVVNRFTARGGTAEERTMAGLQV
jgi:hypothetical protein